MSQQEDRFKYSDLDGLININTLSPFSKFYYRVQKPDSINMSNFACRIAFYNISGELLYHRKDAMAHWLEPWVTIEVVRWSQQGNMAYIAEYKRDQEDQVNDSVFLLLNDRVCYRIDEFQNKLGIVHNLNLKDRAYDENAVISKLKELGYQAHPFIKDNPQKSILKKWYPKI